MDEEIDDKIINIAVKGPKEVTAAEIDLPTGVSIVNKDQYLFTVTKSTKMAAITPAIAISYRRFCIIFLYYLFKTVAACLRFLPK